MIYKIRLFISFLLHRLAIRIRPTTPEMEELYARVRAAEELCGISNYKVGLKDEVNE